MSGRTLSPALLAWGLVVTMLGAPIARGARKEMGPDVRTFEITASRFKFDPPLIEVAEGDEVRLVLRSVDGLHGFAIKELKVKVKIPKGGEPVSATFVARRAGTFEILCSEYCGLGHRDTPRLAGYDPPDPLDPRLGAAQPLSFGIEKRVGGHAFQLNFSNGFGTTYTSLARGASQSDWFIGFNLSRKFY